MKRALVTGANRGIGFAIAKGLVDKGLEVFLGSRDRAAGEEAASKIGAKPLQIDVGDPQSIATAMKELENIDVLINNAGVYLQGMPSELNKADLSAAFHVNLLGPWYLTNQLIPILK